MNSVLIQESPSVDIAPDLFMLILKELKKGSQCPCGLAVNLTLDEKLLFPFLAEMLARFWITILLSDEFEGADIQLISPRYRPSLKLRADLDSARKKLQSLMDDRFSDEAIIARTHVWYNFFRSRKTDNSEADSAYYISLTDQGLRETKHM